MSTFPLTDDKLDRLIASVDGLRADLKKALELIAQSSNCPSDVNANVRKPAPASTLLTRSQMAELLGCDTRSLRRWELGGEIPRSIHIGKSKRWRRGDIEKWLEGRRK